MSNWLVSTSKWLVAALPPWSGTRTFSQPRMTSSLPSKVGTLYMVNKFIVPLGSTPFEPYFDYIWFFPCVAQLDLKLCI